MRSKWIEGYEGRYKITDQAEIISYCKDKNGNVIAAFNSITEAARATKPNSMSLASAISKIKQVCEGYTHNGYTRKTAYGYKWPAPTNILLAQHRGNLEHHQAP